MSIMKFEILFDSQSLNDRKLLAYSKALYDSVLEIDLYKEKISGTRFAEIANKATIPIINLIDHGKAREKGYSTLPESNEDELLEVLHSNPCIAKTPILLYGDQVYFLRDIADINRIEENVKHAAKSSLFQQ